MLVVGIASLVDTPVKVEEENSRAATDRDEVVVSGRLGLFDVVEKVVLVWLAL